MPAIAEPEFGVDEAIGTDQTSWHVARLDNQAEVETKTDLPAFDVSKMAACAVKDEPVEPLVKPVSNWPVSARPLEVGDLVWFVHREHGKIKVKPALAIEKQFVDPAKDDPEQWIFQVFGFINPILQRQVKYCGGEWASQNPEVTKLYDCCWCWPGEGSESKDK
jgi:hypothetical protein